MPVQRVDAVVPGDALALAARRGARSGSPRSAWATRSRRCSCPSALLDDPRPMGEGRHVSLHARGGRRALALRRLRPRQLAAGRAGRAGRRRRPARGQPLQRRGRAAARAAPRAAGAAGADHASWASPTRSGAAGRADGRARRAAARRRRPRPARRPPAPVTARAGDLRRPRPVAARRRLRGAAAASAAAERRPRRPRRRHRRPAGRPRRRRRARARRRRPRRRSAARALRDRVGGFASRPGAALAADPALAAGYAHVVAVDPPAHASLRALAEALPGDGWIHLAWGDAERELAAACSPGSSTCARRSPSLPRAAGRGAPGGAAGERRSQVAAALARAAGPRQPRSGALAGRLLRVLAELELVVVERATRSPSPSRRPPGARSSSARPPSAPTRAGSTTGSPTSEERRRASGRRRADAAPAPRSAAASCGVTRRPGLSYAWT